MVDALAIVLLLGAGLAFFLGARHIASREDLHALFWMIAGIALTRACSNLARADRGS